MSSADMSEIAPTDPSDKESYEGYSVDDEDQPAAEDMLLGEQNVDEMDRGYSPPEHYSAAQGFGNTPYEEALGETLDQRLAQEIPEPDPYAERPDPQATGADGLVSDLVDDVDDGEVGNLRAGRLVDPDQGFGTDTESELLGTDVGIDGAAASAEEAAMHIIDEPYEDKRVEENYDLS